jgi:hypothetical protein
MERPHYWYCRLSEKWFQEIIARQGYVLWYHRTYSSMTFSCLRIWSERNPYSIHVEQRQLDSRRKIDIIAISHMGVCLHETHQCVAAHSP